MSEHAKNVYQLIAAVSAELAQTGISKSRKNEQQGYRFRGIDETLNALSHVLAKHGLIVIPRMTARSLVERQTKKGDPLFSVTVDAEFDFVSAHDGSRHTARTYGEAMDTADKATNKAMSVAYKYAAFLTFCIPLEGMAEDADAITHEVAAQKPDGYDDNLMTLEALPIPEAREAFKLWTPEQKQYFLRVDTVKSDAFKAKGAAFDMEQRKSREAA